MARADDTAGRVRNAHQRALAPGEIVFDEGEAGDALFVVQSGEIELARRGPCGFESLERLGAGEFFGEIPAVAGTRRTARAVAVGAASVLCLDRETLEAMCASRPEIALRLIRGLARRLLDAEERLARADLETLLRPLARAIRAAAEPDPRHGARIPLTLRELAEASGLSMVEAHRALQRLFERGRLQLIDDRLVVSDLASIDPTPPR